MFANLSGYWTDFETALSLDFTARHQISTQVRSNVNLFLYQLFFPPSFLLQDLKNVYHHLVAAPSIVSESALRPYMQAYCIAHFFLKPCRLESRYCNLIGGTAKKEYGLMCVLCFSWFSLTSLSFPPLDVTSSGIIIKNLTHTRSHAVSSHALGRISLPILFYIKDRLAESVVLCV